MAASKIVEQLLTLARDQIGTVEHPPNSNKVKYNEDFGWGNIHWCLVFIWWLFWKLEILNLFFSGEKCAYVPAFQDWARKEGLLVDEPRPGDLICFDFNGNGQADHIGLCEYFDGTYVTTIDGNTGVGNEANGGAVMARRRHKRYIVAVIRPKYEEETELNENQIRAIVRDEMEKYLSEQDTKAPEAVWQKEGLARAKTAGVTDGSRPMALCTRLEAAIMATNAKK